MKLASATDDRHRWGLRRKRLQMGEFLHRRAESLAQPFATKERYGCGIPLAGIAGIAGIVGIVGIAGIAGARPTE